MELTIYDIIEDKDANIKGIVVEINEENFKVLWVNNVLGTCTYNDECLINTGESVIAQMEKILNNLM